MHYFRLLYNVISFKLQEKKKLMNKILSFYLSLMRKLRLRSFSELPKVLAVGCVRFVLEFRYV